MANSFYPNAQNLIDDALECIRVVDPEGSLTPTTTQETKALRALNYLVLSWIAIGMEAWAIKTTSLTLTSSTTSYTLGPSGDVNIQRPLAVLQAYLHNTSANTDPLQLQKMGREDYHSLTNKNTSSTPIAFWYDPQYDLPGSNSGASAKGKIYIYPAADATASTTYTVTLVYSRPIQDFSVTSDSLDFPQEWYNALKWNLADQICPNYGVPILYWDRISSKAEKELNQVKGWDHDDGSTYIQPAHEHGR